MKHISRLLIIAVFFINIFYNRLYADDESVTSFEDLITIRTAVQMPDITLEIMRPGTSIAEGAWEANDSIYYWPNSGFNLGTSISYMNYGFSFFSKIPNSEDEKDIKGETEYLDIQPYYYARGFGIDLFYQKYKGFYLEDPEKHDPTWQVNMPYPQRPDLSVTSKGINFYYNFFPGKISLKAAFDQSEKQNRCGASLFLMASQSEFTVKSSYSLIPANEEQYFKEDKGLYKGRFITTSILPGAGFSLVFYNFNLTAIVFIGAGYQFQKYNTDSGEIKQQKFIFRDNTKISFGYDNGRGFGGLFFIYDGTYSSLKDSAILFEVGVIEFYGGIRF